MSRWKGALGLLMIALIAISATGLVSATAEISAETSAIAEAIQDQVVPTPEREGTQHHPVIAPSSVCNADGSWNATFTAAADAVRGLTWQITASTGGWTPSGSQADNLPFIKVVSNIPNSTSSMGSGSTTFKWSNNTTSTGQATANKPAGCTVPQYRLNLSHIECVGGEVEIHFVLLNVPSGVTPGSVTYTYGTIPPGPQAGNVWHYYDYLVDGTYNVTSASVVVNGVTVQLHNPGDYSGTYDCAPNPSATLTASAACLTDGTGNWTATFKLESTNLGHNWGVTIGSGWSPSGSQPDTTDFTKTIAQISSSTTQWLETATVAWSNTPQTSQTLSATVNKPTNCNPIVPSLNISVITVCYPDGRWKATATATSSFHGMTWQETSSTVWTPSGSQADTSSFSAIVDNIPNATSGVGILGTFLWSNGFSASETKQVNKPTGCVVPPTPSGNMTSQAICHANGTWSVDHTASSTINGYFWSLTGTGWSPSGQQPDSTSFTKSVGPLANATASHTETTTASWNDVFNTSQSLSKTTDRPTNCVVPPTPVGQMTATAVCHANGTWTGNFTMSSNINGYNWSTSASGWSPSGSQADSATFTKSVGPLPNSTASSNESASVSWTDPFNTTQSLSATVAKPDNCNVPVTPVGQMTVQVVCHANGTWDANFVMASSINGYQWSTSAPGWSPAGSQPDSAQFSKSQLNIPNGTATVTETGTVSWTDPLNTSASLSATGNKPENCTVPAVPTASISATSVCEQDGEWTATFTLTSSQNGYNWDETSSDDWKPTGQQPDTAPFVRTINNLHSNNASVGVNATVVWTDIANTTQQLSATVAKPVDCNPVVTPQVTPTEPGIGEPFRGCRLVLDPAFTNHIGDPVRFYDRTDGHVAVDWIDAIKSYNGQVVLEFPFANMVGGEYLVEYGNPPKGTFVARGCVQPQATPRPIPASGSFEVPQNNNTPWGLVVLAFLVILSALAFKARTK